MLVSTDVFKECPRLLHFIVRHYPEQDVIPVNNLLGILSKNQYFINECRWLVHRIGGSDRIVEHNSSHLVKNSYYTTNSVTVHGDLVIEGNLLIGGYLYVDGSIVVNGFIDVLDSITAGGRVTAKGFILSGGCIRAGTLIAATGSIEARGYIAADAIKQNLNLSDRGIISSSNPLLVETKNNDSYLDLD